MQEQLELRIRTSALADLGPLPEVVESNSDTTWMTFLQLEVQQSAGSSETSSAQLAGLEDESLPEAPDLSVEDAMAEARRFNRICPAEPEWLRLQGLLTRLAGAGSPPAIHGAQARSTAPLTKRIRMRDQVEWAARHGCLEEMFTFLKSLPENRWIHMGE
jgi:hypothetical protein